MEIFDSFEFKSLHAWFSEMTNLEFFWIFLKQVTILNFLTIFIGSRRDQILTYFYFYYCTRIFISLLAFFYLLLLADCRASCSHCERHGVVVNIPLSGANTERELGGCSLWVELASQVSAGDSWVALTSSLHPKPQQEQFSVFYSI